MDTQQNHSEESEVES